MEKLKPCPFCGSDDMRVAVLYGMNFVECRKCGSSCSRMRMRMDAIKAWNTRAERTCHDLEPSFYTFGCDKCGVLVEGGDEIGVLVSPEVIENRLFNYCPNCGAKVVE